MQKNTTLKNIESNIFINNLRLYAYHGVMPQERKVGGWFLVTIHITYNFLHAMASDVVTDTISYADICELIKKEMAKPSQLLEHVSGRIVNSILNKFPNTEAIRIQIVKENPPMGANCDGAGVNLYLINDKTID